jgi:zinc transporter 1/2/3
MQSVGYTSALGLQGAWGLEVAELDTPERDRWVGLGGRNKVVGGLFLHTTRKAKSWLCPSGKFAMSFALGCSAAAVPLLSNSVAVQQVLDYMTKLFPGASNEVFPYGVDPVFLRSSSLYQPDLVGFEGDYYNTSDPAEVSAATGVPYGYFPRALKVGFGLCLDAGGLAV